MQATSLEAYRSINTRAVDQAILAHLTDRPTPATAIEVSWTCGTRRPAPPSAGSRSTAWWWRPASAGPPGAAGTPSCGRWRVTWSAWLLASSILLSPGDPGAVDVFSDTPAPNAQEAANEAACFAVKAGGLTFPVRVALRVWTPVGGGGWCRGPTSWI